MKCINCGQELSNDIKFCTNCGSPINQFSSQQVICTSEEDVLLSTIGTIPNYRIVSSMGVVNATWAEFAATRSKAIEVLDMFTGNAGADTYITYTEEKCYESVIKRIKEMAKSRNCNAVVGLRFGSHFSENVLRVTAYGTACVVEPI